MKLEIWRNATPWLLLFSVAFFSHTGCSQAQESPTEEPQVQEAQPAAEEIAAENAGQETGEDEVGRPEEFPDTVARVNAVEITRASLLESVAVIRTQMNLPAGDLPLRVYRDILNRLVDIELLYQESQRLNLTADAEAIQKQYSDIRSQFSSEEDFASQLDSRGLTPEGLRESLRRELSVQNLVESRLAPNVEVTEEAKRQFYEERKAEMQEPEKLEIQHILVSVEPEGTEVEKSAARSKIDRLRQQVVNEGSDFGALARQYSDDPGSKDSDGRMTTTRGQTVPPFEEAAFALDIGEVSEVVETRFGYHLIKLAQRTPARNIPYDQVESMIERYLGQNSVQEKVESELKNLRGNASIEVLI